MQKENLIQISGTVETIIYKNEETGFTVLELDHDGEPLTVVRGAVLGGRGRGADPARFVPHPPQLRHPV